MRTCITRSSTRAVHTVSSRTVHRDHVQHALLHRKLEAAKSAAALRAKGKLHRDQPACQLRWSADSSRTPPSRDCNLENTVRLTQPAAACRGIYGSAQKSQRPLPAAARSLTSRWPPAAAGSAGTAAARSPGSRCRSAAAAPRRCRWPAGTAGNRPAAACPASHLHHPQNTLSAW